MLISGRRAVRVLLSWLCVLLVAAECCGQSGQAAPAPAYADVPNGDFELAHESGE